MNFKYCYHNIVCNWNSRNSRFLPTMIMFKLCLSDGKTLLLTTVLLLTSSYPAINTEVHTIFINYNILWIERPNITRAYTQSSAQFPLSWLAGELARSHKLTPIPLYTYDWTDEICSSFLLLLRLTINL